MAMALVQLREGDRLDGLRDPTRYEYPTGGRDEDEGGGERTAEPYPLATRALVGFLWIGG